MFCYVGKATKIFIFIIAVIVVTGLVIGFGLLGRNIHPKSHKCSGEDCSVSNYSPPPPPPLQIPFPSLPDPNASNPSDPIVNSNAPPSPPPPPPSETTLSPPPSASITNPSLSPPFPPPPPVSVVTPPAAVTAAPPQAVQVSPGPTNSS